MSGCPFPEPFGAAHITSIRPMLAKGECSLLRIQASFPLLLQFSGIFVSVALFVYRTSDLEKKRYIWSTSTSLLLFHVALYVTLLGLLLLICFQTITDLCASEWTCVLLTLLNWIVNGASLHYAILPKFALGVYLQVLIALIEVVFVLYTTLQVLFEADVIEWWYWPILLGVVLWCFLCNIGFVSLLYGGRPRSSSTGSDLASYALLSDEPRLAGAEARNVGITEGSISLSVAFLWFTEVLQVGNLGSMTIDDLPALPTSMTSLCTRRELQQQAEINHLCPSSSSSPQWNMFLRFCGCASSSLPDSSLSPPTPSTTSLPPMHSTSSLFYSLLATHKNIFITQGLLKLVSLCLSFAGPLLLGEMVKLIEKESDHKNVLQGLLLTVILGVSFLMSSLVNVQYSIRGDILRIKLKNSLSLSIFSRVIDLPLHDMLAKDITDAQASNMLQVDVDKVSTVVNSFHDLWSLPVQIGIAFLLLYLQVDVAFVAGVVIIIVMIPINNLIAKQIGVATEKLLTHKDARVKFVSECFRGIKSIKASGWEGPMLKRSMQQRDKELKYLSRRKYLDALCVFLWASMPLLVPFATFVTTVTLVKETLTVSQVFTTIALLNMLIFPMNAFPWIINGFVEAMVSFRRLSVVLVDSSRSSQKGGGFSDEGSDPPGSSSSVVLGGKLFLDGFTLMKKEEGRAGGRFFSFITDSSRLYSFIDEILEDSELPDLHVEMEKGFQAPNEVNDEGDVLVHADSIRGSWQGVRTTSDESLGNAVYSVGPLSLSDVRRGQMIIICGSVGSGKSTLIYSLLQECCVSAATTTSYGEVVLATNTTQARSCSSGSSVSGSGSGSGSSTVRSECIPLPSFLHGTASLCPQKPALHSGTVKSNVLFESPYDPLRYEFIMKGCCLDEDFVLSTPHIESTGRDTSPSSQLSDDKSIGAGGNKLSGGQKLRVGIARALYARTDVVLLDDPLSALDTHTARRVMTFIHQICRDERRVVVVTTNDVYLACHCEHRTNVSLSSEAPLSTSLPITLVFLSRERGVVKQGTFVELFASSDEFRHMVENETHARRSDTETEEILQIDHDFSGAGDDDGDGDEGVVGSSIDFIPPVDFEMEKETEEVEEAGADTNADVEKFERGNIRSAVVLRYLHAVGVGTAVIILLSALCMQATANGMTLWLAFWTDHEDDISNSTFLIVSCSIVAANVFFALVRSFSFAYGGLKAARSIYRQLTTSTLRTYLHFFEIQSLGRLLNRFGNDSECIDEDVPFMLNIVLAQVFTLTGALGVIVYSSPMVILVLFLVGYGYNKLQRFYRHSSRDLRRLESTYASPVGTILMDCLANAPVIRAQQLQNVFDIEFSKALDKAQQVSLSAAIASQWLGLRLQLLGLVVIVSIAVLAVVNSAYEIVPMSGSKLGLSLSYAFALVGYVNGLVDSASRVEQEMISVERVGEYVSLPDEFENDNSPNRSRGDSSVVSHIKKFLLKPTTSAATSKWPENGDIELDDVSFNYAGEHEEFEGLLDGRDVFPNRGQTSSNALSNISLKFSAGSRTVIIGRTGSGKTSLLRIILNLSTSFRGSVRVGGRALDEIPKDLLRTNVGIISQETFLFTGTIRDNIDLFGHHSDDDIMFVLNKCGVLDTFSTSPVVESTNATTEEENSFHSIASCSGMNSVLDVVLVDSSLSQGQKQLLAVARILLHKPPFVLLDEASSSLDPLSEARMYQVLKRHLPGNTTLLAVNHRYERSVIQELCPQVLELSKGRVVRYCNEITLAHDV